MLGPNGAGKTTTTEILEGYRGRDSGDVSVLGFDPVTGRRPYRSDRRPSQGAARNWAAKNEVDSSVICRMVPPNCPSA